MTEEIYGPETMLKRPYLLAPGQLAKNQFPESQFHEPTLGQTGLLPYFSKYDAFVSCIITTWNAH